MPKVAVLGGGGTGCYIAGELTLRGIEVALYEKRSEWAANIDAIVKNGGIKMTGNGLNGFAAISQITDNIEEAVTEARLIIVSMVAWRHRELAELLKPFVRDDMAIVFSAGNFGSIVFRRIFGKECKALIGETQGNMFSCRMLNDAEGFSAGKYSPKYLAAFPGKDTKTLMERFSEFYPCLEAKNVFDTALNAPNIVIHLAGSVLNTGAVEKNPEYALYSDGITPGVIRCQKAVEEEKFKVMKAMGWRCVLHTDHMEKVIQYDKYPELDAFRSLKGPDGMKHRYIVEDATTGDSILLDLGKRLGIELPVLSAAVRIAGAINGTDYEKEGLKLEDLGIRETTTEGINRYLQEGF